MKIIIVLTTLFIAITFASIPATIINIPDDYPTIQAGIDASSDCDTVLVQPGTYVENIDFNGHNIVVGSLFLTIGDTSYISSTVIDGDSSGSIYYSLLMLKETLKSSGAHGRRQPTHQCR